MPNTPTAESPTRNDPPRVIEDAEPRPLGNLLQLTLIDVVILEGKECCMHILHAYVVHIAQYCKLG